ncbi:hypothetical protein [Rhodobacter capsulatus]|uniref:hypothetical protein n=1 Tax=Rhodobacter capsulatus TaxID=1061 RepID=UPI004028BAFD
MMTIDDLRRARKAAADSMSERAEALAALEAAETPDAAAISAAETAFAAAQSAFEAADKQVKRAEAVEAAKAAAAGRATPIRRDPGREPWGGRGSGVAAVPKDPAHKGIEVGLIVGALAAQRAIWARRRPAGAGGLWRSRPRSTRPK